MPTFETSLLLAVYVYYIMVRFKTTLSFHHPLELVIQRQPIGDYLRHPVATGTYENKVCPLGHTVAKLLAGWLLLRHVLPTTARVKWSNWIWWSVLGGGLLMNMNVFAYILPAYLIDIYIQVPNYFIDNYK